MKGRSSACGFTRSARISSTQCTESKLWTGLTRCFQDSQDRSGNLEESCKSCLKVYVRTRDSSTMYILWRERARTRDVLSAVWQSDSRGAGDDCDSRAATAPRAASAA